MKTLPYLVLPLTFALAGLAPAQQEDDRENDTPTATYWNVGRSEAQINALGAQGWRPTDLQIESTNPYRFTVSMVQNTGSYAVTWWWYYGITASALQGYLSQNNARLIDLEIVDNGSGSPRFTCIMVANTGSNAKAWGWLYNASQTAITNLVNQGNRIVDLERYTLNGTTYFACVVIANSGRDARTWWYYYGVSRTTMDSLLSQNNARIYDVDRDGSTYDVVMLRQGSQKNWRYYGIDAQGVTDRLSQIGARLIDVQPYSTVLGTRYDVVFINNSNALSTRISEILRGNTDGHSGVYLKRANGPVLAYINGDRVHEPASTLKTLHHLHAMRTVQLGGTTLTTNYTTFTAGGPDSCPGGSSTPVVESLQSVLSQMMDRSDNNRTRTVTDNFGGFTALNARATELGMNSTRVRHHIGCGTPSNETTLRDIAHLHERVVNGYLGSERQTFYDLMRNDYAGTGYAEGELWPILQAEAAAVGLSSAQLSSFRSEYLMAFKKGGYSTGAGYFRCWGGYVRMPVYQNGGIVYREYLVGSFVAEASNETQAIAAAKFAAAEVLREELRSALASWATYQAGAFATYGSACAGSAGTPVHSASGTPELGQEIVLSLTGAPRLTPCVLYLGASRRVWNGLPLPFDLSVLSAPGCFVRTSSDVAISGATSFLGSTNLRTRIPIDTSFLGTRIHSQYLVLDAGANRGGITTTQGIETTIGGRR